MTTSRARLLLAALLLASFAACSPGSRQAGTVPHSANRLPMYGGVSDTIASHAAVVYISLGQGFCSGTLIAPRVVLTAAHCLENVAVGSIQVGFGHDSSAMTYWTGASQALPHPSYDPYATVNDIALIRLDADAPAGTRPVPTLPASLALKSASAGTELVFSGFGDTETGSYGIKLKAPGTVGLVCEGLASCSYRSGSVVNRAFGYSQTRGGPCSGDSGGPAFVTLGGVEYVAGVTSYGDQACTDYGVSTNVGDFQSFIDGFIGGTGSAADGASCGYGGDCQSGFCVDGVCCHTACGSACTACARARGASADGICTTVGGSCDDGDLCTTGDSCQAGICKGTPVTCQPSDPCRNPGACDSSTGQCGVGTIKPNGLACGGSDACTETRTCLAGTCTAKAVICQAQDECHAAGQCDVQQGGCSNPAMADGTACSIGTCQQGECRKPGCGCGAGGEPMIPLALALGLGLRASLRRRPD